LISLFKELNEIEFPRCFRWRNAWSINFSSHVSSKRQKLPLPDSFSFRARRIK
jgi:hypothetical protein